MKVNRLIAAATTTNPAELTTSKTDAADFETSRWRDAVRGLRWSSDQSISRLKSIAAVRAKTMHATTKSKIFNDGQPFAATTSAPRANGSAKIVCEKRINRRKRGNDPPIPISSPDSCMPKDFYRREPRKRRL